VTLYLTPDRFRVMHTGTDLSVFDSADAELASVLAMASSMADTYCNVPIRPQRHSFLGGSIKAEQHRWRLAQTPFETTQRRVYPFHTPVRRVSSFRIYVTQPDPDVEDGQYVLVDPKDMMVNRLEDYIEVVSSAMTSTGLFNALIVPAIYLASPLATIDYTYGYTFDVTGEVIYPTDGLLYRGEHNFWTDDTVTVYVNGTEVPDTGYTVDRTEGAILFSSPPALGSITVDYAHRLPSEIRDAVGMIASYLIEHANIVSSGLSQITSIKMAEVAVARQVPKGNAGDTRSWVVANVPGAAMMLDDFSVWRAAA
jgi:hypothetical protein